MNENSTLRSQPKSIQKLRLAGPRFDGNFKRTLLLTAAVAWMILFAPFANAQQFSDVSEQAGLHRNPTRAWGNPLWGDFNNDGLLDLLVPNHELQLSGGPYVYLSNGDGTFTDVISTSGVG